MSSARAPQSAHLSVWFLLTGLFPASSAAQSIREWQVHGVATLASDDFLGGGIGIGIRPPGRLGFSVAGSIGSLEGALAGRGEALLVMRLNPYRRAGLSPYGAVGVAGLFTDEAREGYLVVLLGLESRPGARAGWFAEAGVGGGARLAAGVRIRRIRPSARR